MSALELDAALTSVPGLPYLPSPVPVPQGIVKQEPHLHTWEGKQVKVGQCLSETWKLI